MMTYSVMMGENALKPNELHWPEKPAPAGPSAGLAVLAPARLSS